MDPVFIFRSPGIIIRARYSYDMLKVVNEEWMKHKLANGWYKTLDEALLAAGENALRKKKTVTVNARKPSKPLDGINHRILQELKQQDVEQEESAPPTREELFVKAKELGLKFGGRTSNEKLSSMIEEALKTRGG